MRNVQVIFHYGPYSSSESEPHSGSSAIREAIAALVLLLRRFGPTLRHSHCGTLKESKQVNMKELRLALPGGEWCVRAAGKLHLDAGAPGRCSGDQRHERPRRWVVARSRWRSSNVEVAMCYW